MITKEDSEIRRWQLVALENVLQTSLDELLRVLKIQIEEESLQEEEISNKNEIAAIRDEIYAIETRVKRIEEFIAGYNCWGYHD
jgi:hypothetical protein